MVVKRRKSEGYNVIANLALGQNIQIDMMPDPLCEDDADGFLNLLASSWNAIQFEDITPQNILALHRNR